MSKPHATSTKAADEELVAAFVEAAHRYSECGWALIRTQGKRPRDEDWQRTLPAEPGFAAGQWMHWGRSFNMGVVLGTSELVVCEYDDDSKQELFLELLGGELPATPVCRTGSGKLHVYFADPGTLEKRVRDGLELRVGSHQCLLPPSRHPETGRQYEWVAGHEPWTLSPASVPAAVVSYFTIDAETTRRNGKTSAVGDEIPEGQRDATLVSLAGSMRHRGMGQPEILAALSVANRERCRPPLAEGDVERIAASVSRYEPGKTDEPEPPLRLEVMTARELCALPDPGDTDHLLGPLVVRRQRIIVGAHTGEGKTTLELAIVGAVARRRDFLGWTGRGGNVLVFDLEQGLKSIKRRLREAELDTCDGIDYVRIPDGLALDRNSQHVAVVEEVLEQKHYDLVAFDPLYKAHAGDSNAEREAVDLMKLFDRWRERFGHAECISTHCRKPVPGTKFTIHDLFGSSAFVRGAEVVLGLQRVRDGYAKLHFLKDRDGDLPIGTSWGLLFDRELGFRRDPDDGKREPTTAEQVAELLEETPWMTKKQLVAATGRKPRTVEEALREVGAVSERRGGAGGHAESVYALADSQPTRTQLALEGKG